MNVRDFVKSLASQAVVEALPHPEHCGDWHDKPLKWAVKGPGQECQKFHTKADAVLYRRIRTRITCGSQAQAGAEWQAATWDN